MFARVFAIAALIATASAGIATSYAVGGIGLGGLEGGIGLRGVGTLDGGLRLGGLGGGIVNLGSGLIGGGGLVGRKEVDLWAPPKYEFKYGVGDPKTGDRKEQSEVRVGDVVKGEYSLAEPDGTIRVVKYTADDKNGFNAVVSRVGHAAHPQVLLTKGGLALGGIGLGGL